MRYVATGRVHPERADIRFTPIEWTVQDNGRVAAYCDASQITIMLDLKSIDGPHTALVTAEHFAIIIIGALGFSLGCGYSVELIQVTSEDGAPSVFGVRPWGNTADETLKFEPNGPILNRAFRLSTQDVFFRLALRDYLRSITDSTDCATYCYRAIESIRASFVFKTGVDKWDSMHAALGTDRSSIESTVKRFADPVRHGNWADAKPTDRLTRWKMLSLTRDILLKYLDHELPESNSAVVEAPPTR